MPHNPRLMGPTTRRERLRLLIDPMRVTDALSHSIAFGLTALVVLLATDGLLSRIYSISPTDDRLGGLWAVVSALNVYRLTYAESRSVAITRVAATGMSFVLCFVYLLLFPFHPIGMAVLITMGAFGLFLTGRSDDVIPASVATAVVLIIASVTPSQPWREAILRFVDTAIGAVLAIAAVWLETRLLRQGRHPSS